MVRPLLIFALLVAVLSESAGSEVDLNRKLLLASSNGNLDEVHELLELGADPNFRTDNKQIGALRIALIYERVEIAAVLINAGAKPNSREIVIATRPNGRAMILEVMFGAGLDVNWKDNESGNSLLHWAATGGNLHAVETVLARRPDLTVRNAQGNTAAEAAEARLGVRSKDIVDAIRKAQSNEVLEPMR